MQPLQTASLKTKNFLANLKQKIKNAFKRTETAQNSTKGILDKNQKMLENDKIQSMLEEITTRLAKKSLDLFVLHIKSIFLILPEQ